MIKSALKRFISAFDGGSNPAEKCPECGSNLIGLSCPNPDCPAQVRARLLHWCSPGAMDIEGGDEARIIQLVKVGLVRDVAELYLLRAWEVAALDGIDEKSAKNFVDAIAASKKREAWRLLYGLNIAHVDAVAAKSLCNYFPMLDDILASGAERLRQADKVDETIANNVIQWWGDPANRKLIKRLYKYGLNFKSDIYNAN